MVKHQKWTKQIQIKTKNKQKIREHKAKSLTQVTLWSHTLNTRVTSSTPDPGVQYAPLLPQCTPGMFPECRALDTARCGTNKKKSRLLVYIFDFEISHRKIKSKNNLESYLWFYIYTFQHDWPLVKIFAINSQIKP